MRRDEIVAVSLLCITSAFLIGCYYWLTTLPAMNAARLRTESVAIHLVSWDLLLARAVFNVTAISTTIASEIGLQHVEVNGTPVDTYPEVFALKPGESSLIKVYYPYAPNSTYQFAFFTVQEMTFRASYRTPSV